MLEGIDNNAPEDLPVIFLMWSDIDLDVKLPIQADCACTPSLQFPRR